MENIKDKVISIGFVVITAVVFIINIINKDARISVSERRKLTQVPQLTTEKIVNGEVSTQFENYAVDQFIARDFFRSIKANYSLNILNQKDNNNLYEIDGAIYKMQYPVNIANIEKSADKINEIYNKYLQNMNVYYSIIPDKSYYLENDDHLKLDFNVTQNIMNNKLTNIKFIDISESLSILDFYKTDLHWKQENLKDVTNKLKNEMNLNIDTSDYEIKEIGDFYGTYYGQLGINVAPDKLYVLTNATIENCTTYNYETQKTDKVYTEKISSDKYDTYVSGATPLITIENPNANNEKELLLFRDSFGSSLAPLLIENYSKITLIDIRYMSSSLLEKYIDFNNQDVLFLYNDLVLNQGIFK